ncbi:MAG: hypothetical protein HY939_00310 [Gammaproteobacteria bacterium]|nr:hypothetical protein [Gammaproteobacteria bacterium]
MFTRNDFLGVLESGSIEKALKMLQKAESLSECNEEAIEAIKSKTSPTLLYEVAKSKALNKALEDVDTQESAKMLLGLIMKNGSDQSCQNPLNGRTAFSNAVALDNRNIASEMISFCNFDILLSVDKDKNTALHYAIDHCNHALIGKICDRDNSSRWLFFIRNKSGLYSLALALKNYHDHPSALSLSIVNQLYFSLPPGGFRTKAVEEEVKMGGWGGTARPLWKYALRFCGERDGRGRVTSINLELLDLVNKVIEDGLVVWGMTVDKELVIYSSNSYTGTPGELLRPAFKNLSEGVSGRTLGQTSVNSTLAKNEEYSQQIAGVGPLRKRTGAMPMRTLTGGMRMFQPGSTSSTDPLASNSSRKEEGDGPGGKKP